MLVVIKVDLIWWLYKFNFTNIQWFIYNKKITDVYFKLFIDHHGLIVLQIKLFKVSFL